MISIGQKHFIESEYIVEILSVVDCRRDKAAHTAAETGMLIDATAGKRAKSIVKLKSKHIVLSSLRAETLKSRLEKKFCLSASRKRDLLRRKHQKKYPNDSRSSEYDDRRIEPDRRHFSYTLHVPERRSGTERRKK